MLIFNGERCIFHPQANSNPPAAKPWNERDPTRIANECDPVGSNFYPLANILKIQKSENQIWNQGWNSRWRPDRIGRDLWRGPCTLPFIGSTCGGEWHKLRHHQLKFWLQKKAIENLNRESVTIDMAIGTAMFYEEKKYFSKPCFHSIQISRNEKELKQSDWEEI